MKSNKIDLINDLIEKNQRVFKIPVYQRNYDWRKEQCKKLFSDVEKAYKNDKKHFLGTLVYINEDIATTNLTEVLVIDGQQRLTTTYIFLKALLDHLKKIESKEVDNNDEKLKYDNIELENELKEYIFNRRCAEEYKIKLKPIESDSIQLKYLMENNIGALDENSNITKNYNLFLGLIKKSNLKTKQILDGLKKLELIEIILDKNSGDEPQIIFESINSTGLALTLADLIRNYLLMDDEKQEFLFKNYWIKIEDEIGYENIEDFLTHYLNSRINTNINKNNIYENFKIYYKKNFSNHEEILEELKKHSIYYAYFIGRREHTDQEVDEILYSYRKLKQTTLYTFLFKVFEDYEEKKIELEELKKILKFLKSYVVRRIICEIPSNSMKGLFKGLYARLSEYEGNTYTKLVTLLSNLAGKDRVPNDEDFKDALIYKDLYSKKSIGKWILLNLENRGKEKIDDENMTIEHILPRNKKSIVWRKEIGEKDYDRVYEKYIHTIGNLTITGYNGELSTKSFNEKKRILKDSKVIEINKNIIDTDVWNEESILRRAKILAKKIVEMYSYEKPFIKNLDTTNLIKLNHLPELSYTKPTKMVFLGQEEKVKNYSELLDKFMEFIYELEPEQIKELASKKYKSKNSTRYKISYDKSDLRKAGEIKDTGILYEKNYNAIGMMNFIKNTLEELDYDIEEFYFYI